MEKIDISYAREHLDELIERAARGEDIRISDPVLGTMRLEPVNPELDLLAKRFTETLPPFVPLPAPRVPGSWEHRIPPPPADFFDPLSSDELRNWYGET